MMSRLAEMLAKSFFLYGASFEELCFCIFILNFFCSISFFVILTIIGITFYAHNFVYFYWYDDW
jgi:hypothetical protein